MIDFQQVSKAFGAQPVLVDCSFRVNTGERAGIVGPNGAGKTTVFDLISDELRPDSGTVTIPTGARPGYLRQQLPPQDLDTPILAYAESGVAELAAAQHEIEELEKSFEHGRVKNRDQALKRLGELQTHFENLGGYEMRHQAESALSAMGFDKAALQDPLSSLSGGWQMRAELVRVLVSRPDVLLLDEPSNYLDIPAVEWLQRFLRDFEGTLLLISHDRFLLNSLTTVTVEIANARATKYHGNYDDYVRERRRRYDSAVAARKNQARKRERAERFIERFRAKNTRASQVQSKIKMLERMENYDLPQAVVSPGNIRLPVPRRSGQEVIRLENTGYSYDGERWVLREVNLSIERGNRVALVGLNGTGKTTLLRILAGYLPPQEGKRVIGHKVTVGYQSQEFADTMERTASLFDTVKHAGGNMSDQDARALLGSFGFPGDAVQKPVDALSGGEKVRVAFARLLADPPNFLILDEPTTHLDIAARQALEHALKNFKGTLCIVSHDIEFVRGLADTTIAMTPPGITRYWGGYDYYRDKLAEEVDDGNAPVQRQASKRADKQAARRARAEVVQKFSKLRRDLKKELNRVEKRITGFETRQEELVARMSSPDRGTDHAAVNKEITEIQQRLNDYTRRWEALSMELEELESEYEKEKST